MKTYLMRSSQLLLLSYHQSFPIHTKISTTTIPKLSSFIFLAKGKGNSIPFLNVSEKRAYCCVTKSHNNNNNNNKEEESSDDDDKRRSLQVILGAAASILFLMSQDKAWALGPEGPLVEEFWENVRRYALYALTVSTGVIYSVSQPIIELLKNPISALLVLLIIGGSFFIVSQILSAMVGVSDFSYQYAY